MSQLINVYTNEDPYLSYVVVQLVTKAGSYLNSTQASHLIGTGQVKVDGLVKTKNFEVLPPGMYTVTVQENTFQMKLQHSALL